MGDIPPIQRNSKEEGGASRSYGVTHGLNAGNPFRLQT